MTNLHWIEPEHMKAAHSRVMEACLWAPQDIADDGESFTSIIHDLLRLYASGKSRSEIADLMYAAIDDHIYKLVREEAENVLDEEREDTYRRLQAERGW